MFVDCLRSYTRAQDNSLLLIKLNEIQYRLGSEHKLNRKAVAEIFGKDKSIPKIKKYVAKVLKIIPSLDGKSHLERIVGNIFKLYEDRVAMRGNKTLHERDGTETSRKAARSAEVQQSPREEQSPVEMKDSGKGEQVNSSRFRTVTYCDAFGDKTQIEIELL